MTNPVLNSPVAKAFMQRFVRVQMPTHMPEEFRALLGVSCNRIRNVAEEKLWKPIPGRIYASQRLSIGDGVLAATVMLPRNLYRLGSEPDIINRVYDFIETQVVPIHTIPSPDVAKDLLQADSEESIKDVVSSNEAGLVANCDRVVFGCNQERFADEIEHYLEARATFDAKLYRASQATSAVLIDAGMYRRSREQDLNRKLLLSHDCKETVVGRRKSMLDEMVVSEWAVWMTVWNAYSEFKGHEGYPPPTIFNRHGCSHSVKACQYSRVNAIIGIMIAASVLALLEKVESDRGGEL